MEFLVNRTCRPDLETLDRERIINRADACLKKPPVHITDKIAPMGEGGPHDYYSNGDYWWPNPDTPDGLPYVRRDGESNPDAFYHHRRILREMRTAVATLAAAYRLTCRASYAEQAVRFLAAFFLDDATRMTPHLLYAQAIPGVCSGRGIGIIDTLHIVEVPVAIAALRGSAALTPDILCGLKRWFAAYLAWMTTHPYGVKEMEAHNNHGVAWAVQAALFARFTGNGKIADLCRDRYKTAFLPKQMAKDGSFPAELARTKPYGYAIFQLDMMAMLCHILSTPEHNLWTYELADRRGIEKAMAFLYPYLEDKSHWPYPPDVEHFDAWPVRQPALLFAGCALEKQNYLDLWQRLDPDPADDEIRRNLAVRQPLLWM